MNNMNNKNISYCQSVDPSEILDQVNHSLSDVQQSIVAMHGSVASKLDVQTGILNDIKSAHPVQKQSQTKIGKFLNKITKIEFIAVIIAFLQLIIAFPQLQVAYNSLVHNDSKDMIEAFTTFINHTDNLTLIQIPDSLVTPQIAELRDTQNELFINLKILSNADFSLKEFKLDKCNQEEKMSYATNLLLRLMSLGNRYQRVNDIEQKIIRNYYPESLYEGNQDIDLNKLSDIQQILLLYIQIDKLNKIKQIQDNVNDGLAKCISEMSKAKRLDDKINAFFDYMPFQEYAEIIRLQDEVGIAFIKALNQAQYCMAYNISLK